MIGILGCGHLGGYLAAGLARAGRADVMLSPRGQGAALAARHGLRLAEDNAALVRAADVILLAVRPADAEAAVAGLPWRAGQVLVSCCAGVRLSGLGTAAQAMRAMPISAAAIGASPTTVFPDLPKGRAVLKCLGTVIPLASEADFDVASVAGATYGWVHALIGHMADWGAAQGLDAATSRRVAAATFEAAARMVEADARPVPEMVASLATPGGITAAGMDVLDASGAFGAWDDAAAAALRRMRR